MLDAWLKKSVNSKAFKLACFSCEHEAEVDLVHFDNKPLASSYGIFCLKIPVSIRRIIMIYIIKPEVNSCLFSHVTVKWVFGFPLMHPLNSDLSC